MRTKALIMAAAALAAGLVTSNAQVYSANVVGYVNVPAAGGGSYTLAATPLDYDGTGTNDGILNVIGTNIPVNTEVLTWNNATGFSVDSYLSTKSGASWQNTALQLPPGEGYFIYNPSSSTVTNAFVGTVEQGGLTNQFLVGAGYSLIGGNFPVAGGITSTYGYQPSINDEVLAWNGSGYSVDSYLSSKTGAAWSGGEPQITPGEGVFIFTTNTAPVMGTNFEVNP